MFDDDVFNPSVFPARHGGSAGKAIERGMADKVDPNEFRTVLTTVNGITTMLRTRGGRPEYTVQTKVSVKANDLVESDYKIREYHTTVTGQLLRYVKKIFLTDGGYLEFALPPTNGVANLEYEAGVLHYTPDGIFCAYTYEPKHCQYKKDATVIDIYFTTADVQRTYYPQKTIHDTRYWACESTTAIRVTPAARNSIPINILLLAPETSSGLGGFYGN